MGDTPPSSMELGPGRVPGNSAGTGGTWGSQENEKGSECPDLGDLALKPWFVF